MLDEMQLVNFCSFEYAVMPLARQGLVWIGGQNNDSEGASSNGSGKSTLFKALTWGLYGETIDGEKGDGVIRHGAIEAQVIINIAPSWAITRVRKKGSMTLKLSRGAIYVDGDKKDIQAKIDEIIGLDFKAFRNTILYGQNDSARFADPRVRDAERKDMLHRILRTGVLKECHKIALEKAKKAKHDVTSTDAQLVVAKGALVGAKDNVENMALAVKFWDENREKRVADARAEVLKVKASVKALLEGAADVDELRTKEARLQEAIEVAERAQEVARVARQLASDKRAKASTFLARAAVLQGSMNDVDKQLARLKGDKCPLCTSPLNDGHGGKYRKDLQYQRTRFETKRVEQKAAGDKLTLESRYDVERAEKAEAKAARGTALRRSLVQTQTRIHEAETTAERARETLKRARLLADSMKAIKVEANPHKGHWGRAEKSLAAARKKAVQLKRDLHAYRSVLDPLEFWVRGFSGQGLPSYILDGVMKQISDRANHYLGTLSDGDITMEFKTQRELKSSKGDYRDEIDIRWVVEGIAGYPPSGGQQRKMEIATDLALMDLAESHEGSKLNLFIADEILDGLDVEGTDRVLRLLQELRSRRASIFIISHQSSMSEIFEKSFRVVKDSGISTLGDVS